MIILGMGSNVGDRLLNLRQALACLKQHPSITVSQVSPVYQSDAMLPDNAPADWNQSFFNVALTCQTKLTPHALLDVIKSIEQSMKRHSIGRWSPRIIDIDILMWGELHINSDILNIPQKDLYNRPFALWPLMDVYSQWDYPHEVLDAWGSRFDANAPFHTQQTTYRIDGSVWVGILNITPDSFSDGGQFESIESAVHQAERLYQAGAEVIDVGAESTRPGAAHVGAEQEWSRLSKVISAIQSHFSNNALKPKISIDTRHAVVAEHALAMGVDWINDVTAGSDIDMINVLRDSQAKFVFMHSLSVPPAQDNIIPLNKDPIDVLLQWGRQRIDELAKSGIAQSRLIFDPGIGFGKTPEQNLQIIQRANEFKKLGVPVLVGHARKSFHKIITPVCAQERTLETAVGSITLFNQCVDYVRIHNVAYSQRAVAMQKRLDAGLSPL